MAVLMNWKIGSKWEYYINSSISYLGRIFIILKVSDLVVEELSSRD